MIEFGLAWLRRNIPEATGPVVIVQGDTGPGNFLYADGHVTAVLDWELAHWGDPMEDLGWLALRAVQEPFTVLADRLRDYERHTGWTIDLDRVRYYRAFAELRVAILGHRRTESVDLRGEVGNGLIYGELHRRLFCEAIAENLGLPMPEQPSLESPATDVAWLYDAMLTQIREIVVPRSTDAFVIQRAKGMARVLKHLQQVDRYGDEAAAGELADLRELLGNDVISIDDGRAELVKRLADSQVSDADALRYFGRRTSRRTELLRPAMGVLADRHFDPLA
jgi:prepilin-type processing-associated H-X9-DG protein